MYIYIKISSLHFSVQNVHKYFAFGNFAYYVYIQQFAINRINAKTHSSQMNQTGEYAWKVKELKSPQLVNTKHILMNL